MPTAKQVSASPPGLSYWLGELAPEVEAALDRLARAQAARRLWAHDTTLWKPNSTGQLHKGGPATGLFIHLTEDYAGDVPIPGESYSFAVLNRAEAIGDLQSLYAKGRRALRLHMSRGAEADLSAVAEMFKRALDDTQGRV
jgi:hypothetical protein